MVNALPMTAPQATQLQQVSVGSGAADTEILPHPGDFYSPHEWGQGRVEQSTEGDLVTQHLHGSMVEPQKK